MIEKIKCLRCGMSIEVPVCEDLTYEEKLCDLCYDRIKQCAKNVLAQGMKDATGE